MPFSLLPTELLVSILTHLVPRDILRLCATSRFYWTLYKASPRLQLLVALDAYASEDNPRSALGARGRLEYLRTLENSWRDLALDRTLDVALPRDAMEYFALARGRYLTGAASADEEDVTRGFRHLNLRDIQARGRRAAAAAAWAYTPFRGRVLDVALELDEHDLVVVLTGAPDEHGANHIALHCIQLSSGKPHPSAATPVKSLLGFPAGSSYPDAVTEVSGPFILVLLSWDDHERGDFEKQDTTRLIDWKRDTLIWEESQPQGQCGAASFLSPTDFAIAHAYPPVLVLYSIEDGDAEAPLVQAVRVLGLPQLKSEAWIMNIRFDGYPCPQPPSTHSSSTPAPGEPAVLPSAHAAIVIVTLFAQTPEDDDHGLPPRTFSMVVHRRALIGAGRDWAAAPGLDCGVSGAHVPCVPWAHWGPGITRWDGAARRGVEWPHVHAVYGQRRVFRDADARLARIVVQDFNPHNVHRALASRVAPRVVAGPSVLSGHGCFDDITSCLPFVEVLSAKRYPARQILMDNEHIVLIPEEGRNTPRMKIFIMSPKQLNLSSSSA